MKYSVEGIQDWIHNQISKPDANPTFIRSWYKYAKECPEWRNILTYGDAPNFCRLAKIAGKNINQEFGIDVIKLHFYGIWKHNELKPKIEENEWEQNWETHPNGEQIA